MRKFNNVIIFLLLLTLFSVKTYSQTDDEVRVMWIFNIASGTTWENDSNISKYTIGIFSSNEVAEEFKKIASEKKIHGKSVEIVRYENYKDVNPNQIVFVTKNENANLGFIYNQLKEKNVLIISDRTKQPEYSVINLNKPGYKWQPFEINTQLYRKQRLEFSTQLLRLGGDREILKTMQVNTNDELIKLQKKLEEKEKEIEKLKKQLKEKNIQKK